MNLPADPARWRAESRPSHPRATALISLVSLVGILGVGAGLEGRAEAGTQSEVPVVLNFEGAVSSDLDAPLWTAGVLDPAAGLPGRWQRELAHRRAIAVAKRGRAHQAALAILGLPLLSGEVPMAELVAFTDGIRKDPRRHPLVRALAVDVRARLHEDAGELSEARALYADSGRVLSWQVVGPFDNANGGGHSQAFGPERDAFALGQTFEGKLAGEPLAWRPYAPGDTLGGGYLSFDEFLRPNEYVSAYATTWIEVPKAQTAVLHLGTGGAHKVWVGDALVGAGESYRRPDPLQDAYAIELEAGWNRVLIKVGCEQGAWGLFARVSAADGSPISGLRATGTPPVSASAGLPVAAPTGDTSEVDPDRRAPAPPLSLRRMFEDAAEPGGSAHKGRPRARHKVRPEAELELAEFYRWTSPFAPEDFRARDQAREAESALASPRSALYVALLEDDSGRARLALESGVARARAALADRPAGAGPESVEVAGVRSDLAQMLIELAYSNAALGLERRAEALLEEAATVAPDDAMIELARIEELASDGFELAALEWVEDLRARYPHSALVLRAQADRLYDLGRVREAQALFEEHSRDHRGDASVIERRIETHLRLGEVDAAVTLGRASVVAAPGRPRNWRRLARLEEAAGRYDTALAALSEAVELAPQDPELHAALGYLQSRAGDPGASVLAFQRSLELNAQQPEIRDLLSTLGESSDDVFTRYAVDLESIVEAVADEPTPASWKGRSAAILHRMVATRIGSNGLGERLDHRIIKILDERGIASQSRHDFGYEPDESYVEVRRARVYRSDGRIEDIGVTQHYSVGNAGYRMYYDQRGVSVEFPGLRVGDVVEVAFVRRDVASRNKFDEYYGDLVPLDGVEPNRHLEYLIEAPVDMVLHANHPLERVVSEDGARAVHRLVRTHIEGIRPEGDTPGWTEVADYLHVSTYATWDEVGRWYWGLVEGQLLVDDAIQGGVAEALETLPKGASERDKVAALYRHVIKSTRYVGLEFGIHGYKPYRTTDIYNRRFGDCKDKASLLKVMLGEIGVQAHLVLVRTRDMGSIAALPASLSAFNHAIVYVPKYDLYMDGTAEFSGAFELPAGDQGASVVIIEDGEGASFRTIPFSGPDQNHAHFTQGVHLAADGSARVDYDMTLTGTGASSWRSGLEAQDQREERLTKMISSTYPGASVARAAFLGIDDVLTRVELDAELDIPAYATVLEGGSSLRWRALGHESDLLRGYAAQKQRVHPLQLGVPSRESQHIQYTLPRGLRFSQIPVEAEVESAFGHFELRVEVAGQTATVDSNIEFRRARVEAAEYAAFREFLAEVDAAMAQSFEAGEVR